MTTYLGKSCSFGLPWVPFVNCHQFMYLVISLLVLRAGCGIWLYQFLNIAYLFTFLITRLLYIPAYPEYTGGAIVTEFAAQMISPDNTSRECYKGRDLDCIVAGLSPGRPYLFQVRAFNRAGVSIPKNSDTRKIAVINLKNWIMWIYHRVMPANNADRVANSVDPDQTEASAWPSG